jgi:hypothetical protein
MFIKIFDESDRPLQRQTPLWLVLLACLFSALDADFARRDHYRQGHMDATCLACHPS